MTISAAKQLGPSVGAKVTSVLRRSLLVGLALLVCGELAPAGEYTDPSGFSLQFPDDWIAVNSEIVKKSYASLPPELQLRIDNNRLQLDQVEVQIFRIGPEEFLENIYVAVDAEEIRIGDATIVELIDETKELWADGSVKVSNVRGGKGKVGTHDAIVIDCDMMLSSLDYPLRVRQFHVPGGGRTYIITCTATTDSFNSHLPQFEAILMDFDAPEPISWQYVWKKMLAAVGVGLMLIGVIGLVVWVKRKLADKPPVPSALPN